MRAAVYTAVFLFLCAVMLTRCIKNLLMSAASASNLFGVTDCVEASRTACPLLCKIVFEMMPICTKFILPVETNSNLIAFATSRTVFFLAALTTSLRFFPLKIDDNVDRVVL